MTNRVCFQGLIPVLLPLASPGSPSLIVVFLGAASEAAGGNKSHAEGDTDRNADGELPHGYAERCSNADANSQSARISPAPTAMSESHSVAHRLTDLCCSCAAEWPQHSP